MNPCAQASYYLWKWADNDLPGKPTEVFAALMRGELHPALQTFDARPVVGRLEKLAAAGRKRGEEWDWQVHPPESKESAKFVFLTCPQVPRRGQIRQAFIKHLFPLDVSGYDEQTGQLIEFLLPKLNCVIFGQWPDEELYDVTVDELPVLLRRIRPQEEDPYAILVNRRNHFVQCCAHDRRFCVEWRENHDFADLYKFDHWRAGYPPRSARIAEGRRITTPDGEGEMRLKDSELRPCNVKQHRQELLLFADTLRIFEAFLRGEPRPRQYHWRNISEELP